MGILDGYSFYAITVYGASRPHTHSLIDDFLVLLVRYRSSLLKRYFVLVFSGFDMSGTCFIIGTLL